MARREKGTGQNQEMAKTEQPKSLSIAEKGIVTGNDFAGFMSALMSDLISGNVAPNIKLLILAGNDISPRITQDMEQPN